VPAHPPVADYDERFVGGDQHRSPMDVALAAGNIEIIELLVARGAARPQYSPVDECLLAIGRIDHDKIDVLRRERPDIIDAARARSPRLVSVAAEAGNTPVVAFAVWLGFPVNGDSNRTPLHEAAWGGHLETARALIELGADPEIRDDSYGGRPVDWADHAGQQEVADYLRPLTSTPA
jgi:ankyrin repeat protein